MTLPHHSLKTNPRLTRTLEVSAPNLVRALRQSAGRIAALALGLGLTGAILAWTWPETYRSEVKLMPELQGRAAASLRQFSELAEKVGINLGEESPVEAVRPDLYPDVVRSTPFVLHILRFPVKDRYGRTYAGLHDYLAGLSSPWWSRKKTLGPAPVWQAGRPIQLTKGQEDEMEAVQDRITAFLDKRTGIITIAVEMPDPNVAAQVAQEAVDYLYRYVRDYRTGKARQDAAFLSARTAEARRRHEAAERAWATYQDRHRYLVSQLADTEGRRLEARFLFTQNLLNELSRELEQARIRVQEASPVYQVLEPPQIPPEPCRPKRTLIVLGCVAVGTFAGFVRVLTANLVLTRSDSLLV